MSPEPIAPKAMRLAERGARADASRLVASVPDLMREARRRRDSGPGDSPALAQLATWALPRLAAATVLAVVAATSFLLWEPASTSTPSATFESVILGGDGDSTGDAVFDALLGLEENDG